MLPPLGCQNTLIYYYVRGYAHANFQVFLHGRGHFNLNVEEHHAAHLPGRGIYEADRTRKGLIGQGVEAVNRFLPLLYARDVYLIDFYDQLQAAVIYQVGDNIYGGDELAFLGVYLVDNAPERRLKGGIFNLPVDIPEGKLRQLHRLLSLCQGLLH
jgi:hypothetical protein